MKKTFAKILVLVLVLVLAGLQISINKAFAEYCCNVKAGVASCAEASADADSDCKCGLHDTQDECQLLCGTCDGDGSCEKECNENPDTCKDCWE